MYVLHFKQKKNKANKAIVDTPLAIVDTPLAIATSFSYQITLTVKYRRLDSARFNSLKINLFYSARNLLLFKKAHSKNIIIQHHVQTDTIVLRRLSVDERHRFLPGNTQFTRQLCQKDYNKMRIFYPWERFIQTTNISQAKQVQVVLFLASPYIKTS